MLRCLFILLTTPLIVTSQIEYEKRIEVEMKNDFSNVSFYEFGENGVLIHSLNKNVKNNQKEWHYQLYKVKRSFSNINHWYDNYFIAFGKQKIKNKEEKDAKKKRKVYFFTKLRYE